MSIKTTQVDLTGTYQKLSTLIAASLVAGTATWPVQANTIKITADKGNTSGDRVQITSHPTGDPYSNLLAEEEEVFETGGGMNGQSTLDKYLRVVDNAGAASTGKANIMLETA